MVIFLIEEKKDTESVGESALRLCVTPQRGPENCALLDVLFYFILEKLQLPGLATGVVRSSIFIPSLPVFPAPAESPPLLPIAQATESGPRCQLRMPAAT